MRRNRALAAILVLSGPVLLAAPSARAQRPADVLEEHACTACHSLDGSASPGPSLLRVFERTSEVTTGGRARRVRVTDEYVRRAIAEPDADLVRGFAPGSMPALGLSPDERARVVAALHALPREPDVGLRTIWILAPSALLFLFLHLGLSSHPIRSRLVARLGPQRFAGLYSSLVLIALAGIIAGFVVRPFVAIWDPPPFTRWIALASMPLSLFFFVAGFSTPGPTLLGQERRARDAPRGILTVTRHPSLWGFALFALAHLAANGDLASIVLFGSVAVLALAGMAHIDARRARDMGERWQRFAAQTSLVPLAAVLGGRVRLDRSGLGWRALVALALSVALALLHELAIGVRALPYGWP